MKNRVLAAMVCLLLVFTLTACMGADGFFESAMDIITDGQIQSPDREKPEGDKPDTTDPEQPEDKEEDPKQPIDIPDAIISWPRDVPPVTKFNKEFDFTDIDGLFTARYIMTVSQLQIWTASLTLEGYLGDPRVKDGLVVEVIDKETGNADSETGEKLLDVTIRIYEAIRNWPEEFTEFPKFEGKGTVSLFEFYNEPDGTRVLHIILHNEEKGSVEAYLQKLLSEGFENRGEGVYAKEVNGRIYEFNGDPDRIWKGTTAEMFWFIRPQQT